MSDWAFGLTVMSAKMGDGFWCHDEPAEPRSGSRNWRDGARVVFECRVPSHNSVERESEKERESERARERETRVRRVSGKKNAARGSAVEGEGRVWGVERGRGHLLCAADLYISGNRERQQLAPVAVCLTRLGPDGFVVRCLGG
jgi:hypothetical protein